MRTKSVKYTTVTNIVTTKQTGRHKLGNFQPNILQIQSRSILVFVFLALVFVFLEKKDSFIATEVYSESGSN